VVAAAAGGVTRLQSSASPTAPAIQPVVFGAPLPLDSAPNLAGPLVQTLNGPRRGWLVLRTQGHLRRGGLGRIETIAADRAYSKARQGPVPAGLQPSADIDLNGQSQLRTSPRPANNGVSNTQPVTFVNGPSPTGWQISRIPPWLC